MAGFQTSTEVSGAGLKRLRFCKATANAVTEEVTAMGLIGGSVGVRILQIISPDGSSGLPTGTPPAYRNKSKLEVLLGPRVWDEVRDKIVVDFGCGEGHEVVELAERGARQVIGIDTRQKWLDHAAALAQTRGVADRCLFAQRWTASQGADVIVCLDSFEHFDEPADILATMSRVLKPTGSVMVAFGPTWYHPYGGHLFSVFPWAHLVFSETVMLRWRSSLPGKRQTKTMKEAGLNKMTIGKFERLVDRSPFRFASFEAVPIRRLRWLANRGCREFTTSIVRCRLVLRNTASAAIQTVDEPAGQTTSQRCVASL
jgi:2-polyprenyl-3-methyl-5-hydroxy-6-metoxy-1,4-benzoquinol methylase